VFNGGLIFLRAIGASLYRTRSGALSILCLPIRQWGKACLNGPPSKLGGRLGIMAVEPSSAVASWTLPAADVLRHVAAVVHPNPAGRWPLVAMA
jgi:hypothetical protein